MVAFVTLSIPLWWIFLGRAGATGFKLFGELMEFWPDKKRAAFPVFLLIVSLELLPLIVGALYGARRRADLMWPFVLSVMFLLSTFFLSFGLGGNYSMRGSIVPIFVLSYLCVPLLVRWWEEPRSRWATLALSTYFLGGLLEYSWFLTDSLAQTAKSNTELNVALLSFNRGSIPMSGLELREHYPLEQRILAWYLLERPGWSKDHKSDYDQLDAELENDDVGYRVTARRALSSFKSY